MKIISNYKDYYDYLMGIFGVDPKIIYERVNKSSQEIIGDTYFIFHILGKQYLFVQYQGISYLTLPELKELYNHFENSGKDYPEFLRDILSSYLEGDSGWDYKLHEYSTKLITEYPASEINKKENCPIVRSKIMWKSFLIEHVEVEKNPKLEGYKISRVLPAKEMYLGLCEWLAYKEPATNAPPEDMGRFESKGFSKKTSFRKM